MLKAKLPETVKPSKPKIMISGDPGSGKSFFALNWPSPYYFDVERGITRPQYVKKLKEAKGVYFGPDDGSQDVREVVSQIRELATTQHGFKSCVLDSISKLYNLEAASAEERVGSDFGKDKREANKPFRQLMRWVERLDLSVILITHTKDRWERRERELIYAGKTYDGPPKLAYDLDLYLEARVVGQKRMATIVKSRIDAFPVGTEIELSYDTFKKLYGEDVIEQPSVPIKLADKEQSDEIKRLFELLKVSEEDIQKWLNKAQAEDVEDLSAENAEKMLKFLNQKITGDKK